MRTTLYSLIVLFTVSAAWGQGTEKQATDEKPNDRFEQRVVIAAASEDGGAPQLQFFATSSTGDDTMFLASPMAIQADPFSLVNNDSVQKEIELIDEQLEQLNQLRSEFSKKISAQMNDFTSGGFDGARGDQIKQLVTQLKAQQQEQMSQILLPHQLDRLKQIALQVQMQRAGNMETLTSQKIAEALEIDEDQKQQLEDRAKEIKAKLDARIARLKEQAREELFRELSPSQRKKLKEMMGDAFELQTESWRDRVKKMRRVQTPSDNDDQ